MFFELLLSPITVPINSIAWIGEKILDRASTELDEKENLHKRLLALQLAFDMGDVSEEDFEQQEEELLLAIQELQELEEQARAEAEE